LILFIITSPLPSQTPSFAIKGDIRWDRMELSAAVSLNLASAGIRIPTGRSQAEEIIRVEYPGLIRPWILSIPVDSSSTLEDLINRGEFSFQGPEQIAAGARRVPPALSTDLAYLSASYTLDLTAISAQLILHSRAMEIPQPLIPVATADHSGIIIIANGELPVHGMNTGALAKPCIFPKVWDMDMNLIYERNMLDPANTQKATMVRYVSEAEIFRATPSGLSPELRELVGDNPLRIMARGVFGIRATDPIIDRDDAMIILSSEANRRLLREGRVIIVLNDQVLRNPL
jgi:hypothetical protein